MAFEEYGIYTGLYITTPEEMKKEYEQTEQKEIREYRLKNFDEFIKSWKVKYFFNYEFKWDLKKICKILPGLSRLTDHVTGFVNKDGYYFLLLQPYANPEEFRKQNKISKYVKFWFGGFHNPKAYAIVISGDFLTYLERHADDFKYCNEWSKWKPMNDIQQYWIDNIVKISDIHHGAK